MAKTITQPSEALGSVTSYTVGFVLSLLLTFGAYVVVTMDLVTKSIIVPAIIVLAMVQLLVQLAFFLHMGRETKPRWKFIIFLSFVGIILTVVIGSIWIMQHLNYNMGPEQLDKLIQQGEGF